MKAEDVAEDERERQHQHAAANEGPPNNGTAPGDPASLVDAMADPSTLSKRYNHFLVCGHLFEVDAKYKPMKPIGKGAYGVVCSAVNSENGESLAIKKISNAFDNAIDAKRMLREIKLLRHLNHENVIKIKDILPPPSKQMFKDVYLVYELMDTDLHQIIRSSQQLTDEHCQYFIYQVLRGLKYIHSANVLHRDLKPSNVLLNANCDLKICDFGLARTNSEREFMTEYVVTRWYRAPELLLSCAEYTAAIDVWSVGCIFAELLGRRPIFPGKDYVHQISLINQVLGSPDESDLAFIESEKAKRYMRALPPAQRVVLQTYYPQAKPGALDLIDKMLQFNPHKRLTVEQALEHPYFAKLHDPTDEPACPVPFRFPYDDNSLNDQTIRELVHEDIRMYHPGLQ